MIERFLIRVSKTIKEVKLFVESFGLFPATVTLFAIAAFWSAYEKNYLDAVVLLIIGYAIFLIGILRNVKHKLKEKS